MLVAVGMIAVSAALALQSVWESLHFQWNTWLYSHGYLVLAMSAWVAWSAWRRRPPAQLAPNWWWLVPFAGLVLLLSLMEVLFLNVPRLYLLPLLLVAAGGLVFGTRVAQRLVPPALLISFALPFWSEINGILQTLTTIVVTAMLAFGHVEMRIEGNFVILPVGVFEIADGCSGLNYLIVGMTLAAFYGLAFLDTWRRRALLFAVAVAVSIVSNWIRVYIIIVAGYVTNMEHYLVQVDHLTFGWILFMIAFVPVLWYARRLDRTEVKEKTTRAGAGVSVDRKVMVAALAAGVILFLPRAAAGGSGEPRAVEAALPAVTAGGETRQPPATGWQPGFPEAAEDRASYAMANQQVDVYRAIYRRQDPERRLIHHRNRLVNPGVAVVARRQVPARIGNQEFTVNELEAMLEERRLIWTWYLVAGRPATGSIQAKLMELRGILSGRRDAVALAVSAACDPDCDAARARLRTFLEDSGESLMWQP